MKMTFIKGSFLALAVAFSFANSEVFAQGKCGTTEATNELIKLDPSILEMEQLLEEQIQQKIASHRPGMESVATGTVLVVPVVFHVIHMYGPENISDATIINQITYLNRDYRKQNSDTSSIVPLFKPLIADCEIEFRLATKDPNGNCTNGIDRIYSHKTIQANDGCKLNQWDNKKYLNIWVVRDIDDDGAPTITLGYSLPPAAVSTIFFKRDGIVIAYGEVGSASSRTLTHEVGHWLNLAHPWGSTNSPGVACGNDNVADTPETEGSFGCNLNDFTCDSEPLSTSSYAFDSVKTTTGTTDPSPVIVLSDPGVTYGSFIATGVSSNSNTSGMFEFSGWDVGAANNDTVYANLTGSINTSKYYEFTLTPTNGNIFSLTAITFKAGRNSTGVRTFAVRSSVNNYASNLPASLVSANDTSLRKIVSGTIFYIKKDTAISQSGYKASLGGPSYTTTSPITFRIYGWNAEDNAGSFSIDNVTIDGTYGTLENVQNYMDYSGCTKMFTINQKDRMRAALTSPVAGRNNLWSTSNLIATGTDVPPTQACVPVADLYSNKLFICQGTGLGLYGISNKGAATSWSWSMPNGNPSTSTMQSLGVVYSAPAKGWQTVSLTVANASGNDTETKTTSIYVSQPNGEFQANYSDNFDSQGLFNNYWFPINTGLNASQWGISQTASYTGASCVMLNAYSPTTYDPYYGIVLIPGIGARDVDYLVSPSLDMSWVSNMTMTFRIAYASTASISQDMTETLKVFYSINCGETWTATTYSKTGANILTAGHSTGLFTPSSQTDWRQESVTLPAILNGKPNVRFKFEYTSGEFSNNLYLDDFNISGAVGIEDGSSQASMDVFPNPGSGNTTLNYNLTTAQNIVVEITDMLGQVVYNQASEYQSAGSKTVTLPTEGLGAGVYFVRMLSDNKLIAGKKLVMTN